jgi:hypothetical protein
VCCTSAVSPCVVASARSSCTQQHLLHSRNVKGSLRLTLQDAIMILCSSSSYTKCVLCSSLLQALLPCCNSLLWCAVLCYVPLHRGWRSSGRLWLMPTAKPSTCPPLPSKWVTSTASHQHPKAVTCCLMSRLITTSAPPSAYSCRQVAGGQEAGRCRRG